MLMFCHLDSPDTQIHPPTETWYMDTVPTTEKPKFLLYCNQKADTDYKLYDMDTRLCDTDTKLCE